jgi:hypothetical protein
MTLGNTKSLLLVLLVLGSKGHEIIPAPYQYLPGNLDKSSVLLSLKFCDESHSSGDHP